MLSEPKIVETSRGYLQANLNDIKRCARAIATRERDIAVTERKLAQMPSGTSKYEKTKSVLETRRALRDRTQKRFELLLSYALEHTPKNKTPQAQASVPQLMHMDKCKEDIYLCAAIQAGGSAKDEAFQRLCSKYNWIVEKHARHSPLERDDADVLGMKGIWDAALRFDVTRSLACFSTVAYNWVYRNTRARARDDVRCKDLLSYDQMLDRLELTSKLDDTDENKPMQPRFKYKLKVTFK